MALPFEVKVLDIFRISPPAGSVPTTTITLSFLDLSFLALPTPVQILYYYDFHHPKSYFIDTILPNIKHSLSLTLQHYYPLAGQLTWPESSAKPQIVYTCGDSVPLILAESDQDFQHLSGNGTLNANEFYPLAPTFQHATSDNKRVPLFAVQVTLFSNRGICIGIIMNHAALDGAAYYQFMMFWTTVCASQGINVSALNHLLPFHDRTTVKEADGIEVVRLNNLKMMNISKQTYTILKVPIIPVDKVRCAFVMKHTQVLKLRQWVLARVNEASPPLHLSTFVLISSFIWVCLIRARKDTENMVRAMDQTEYFMFSADCRARLNPPLPKTYFGNCILGVMLQRDRSELIAENGFAVAAEAIAKAVMNVHTGEVLSFMTKGLSDYFALPPERTVSIAGSHKFTAYETDFGWGRPKKEEANFPSMAIALSDCPAEDGIAEIKLIRSADEMDAFTSVFEESLKAFT